MFPHFSLTVPFLLPGCQLQPQNGLQLHQPLTHNNYGVRGSDCTGGCNRLPSGAMSRAEAGAAVTGSAVGVKMMTGLSPCTTGAMHSQASHYDGQNSYLQGYRFHGCPACQDSLHEKRRISSGWTFHSETTVRG